MTRKPITIDKDELAAKALSIMNQKKITSLLVNNKKNLKESENIFWIQKS